MPHDYRRGGALAFGSPSPEFRLALRDARRIQYLLTYLLEADPQLLRVENIEPANLEEDPERIAAREREKLGVTWMLQRKWRPSDSFRRWRTIFQSRGVAVLLEKMPWGECRGVSLFDNALIPTILVNSDDTDSARSFTLAHEYGHLLLRQPGECVPSPDSDAEDVELWCNRFAAAFLILEADLRTYIDVQPEDFDLEDLDLQVLGRIATAFRVSRYAMARRLDELDLSDYFSHNKSMLYALDQKVQKVRDPDQQVAIAPEVLKLSEIGSGTSMVIVSAYRDTQIIDPIDAAEALNLDVSRLSDFAARAESQRFRDRAGV